MSRVTPALEIAVTSARDAALARAGGADRVELCQALEVGGVGPTAARIEQAVETGIPVHVLIRARPGDFTYDLDEIRSMESDTADAIARGASGVVIGALTERREIDLDVIARLVDAAAGHEVTLHRAIDRSADPVASVHRVAGRGVRRILTSAGRPTVADGIASGALRRMVANGDATGIEIMAGGGVVESDLDELRHAGVAAVHLSASRPSPRGLTDPLDPDAGRHRVVDGSVVRAFRQALDASRV